MSGQRWHHSPAVRYPVVRSRTLAGIGLGMLALSAAALLAWSWGGVAAPGAWAGAALWLGCAALAARHWQRSPQGWLCWEAGQWRWQAAAAQAGAGAEADGWPLAAPRVSVDAGALLIVHCVAPERPGPALTLCLQRRAAPQDWGDLRRAVYCAALPSEAAGAAPPPGA